MTQGKSFHQVNAASHIYYVSMVLYRPSHSLLKHLEPLSVAKIESQTPNQITDFLGIRVDHHVIIFWKQIKPIYLQY